MKLRILENTIRLRLARDETDRIGLGLPVASSTRFPDGSTFGYELHSGGNTVDATFDAGMIKINVPTDVARCWATNETEVSITGSIDCRGATLKVLVEKDFECLDPREGENNDNRFPNPKKADSA